MLTLSFSSIGIVSPCAISTSPPLHGRPTTTRPPLGIPPPSPAPSPTHSPPRSARVLAHVLGLAVFGRAFLSDDVATKEAGKPSEDQLKGMAGSVMVLRFPTLDDAWARIKADKYWTGGVWDKEKVVVREIIGAPVDETIKIQ